MRYKFIDLFAGIGGFHYALRKHNMECVFASEIDTFARETYLANHQINLDSFNSDIRTISPYDIPEHDLLCAGFPCQPFSQAGYKKGFDDGEKSERGNLFFCILDILEAKRPKAFILENVRHLLNHDNGKTFKIIQKHLLELDYTVEYKIIKASDFGVPQHRPRIFIVGFNKHLVDTSLKFEFPEPIPLIKTMSDIWGGACEKKIGFTLRVGGRGSNINDRRNWDSYLVDGVVKRIGPEEGKKLMGFPAVFKLHSSQTQAMKQLGNSVCPDVVFYVSNEVKKYLDKFTLKEKNMAGDTFNKGEWSEIYAFLSLLLRKKLFFGSSNGEQDSEYVTVLKLKHNYSDIQYNILESEIEIKTLDGNLIETIELSQILTINDLMKILNCIQTSHGSSFQVSPIWPIIEKLRIKKFKGSSCAKGDLTVGFEHHGLIYSDESLGVKSHIGSLPTLLNSSSATNFIFEVQNFSGNIDDVNKIETKSKIRDRLLKIISNGGILSFIGCENKTHEENLRKIDSLMPEYLSGILLSYYKGQGVKVSELVSECQKVIRIKDYLKAILLGMFSTKPWDGNYTSNGYIVVKNQGDIVLYHVIKDSLLKEYIFKNTKLDTPSSTRHRFGSIYKESGKLFIKLNLQIRFI